MIDLDFFFFPISQGTLPWQPIFGLHSAGWRSETGRNMAVPMQKYFMAML